MTFQFPDGYDDTPEIIIDRLRAELADVRAQWQADVGSAIARAQTAEARATQADWRVVQLVNDLDSARAEAARLRSALITYADAREMVLKALPASIVNETEELWGVTNTQLVRRALSYLWHCAALRGPAQSEQPAARRQEANDGN